MVVVALVGTLVPLVSVESLAFLGFKARSGQEQAALF